MRIIVSLYTPVGESIEEACEKGARNPYGIIRRSCCRVPGKVYRGYESAMESFLYQGLTAIKVRHEFFHGVAAEFIEECLCQGDCHHGLANNTAGRHCRYIGTLEVGRLRFACLKIYTLQGFSHGADGFHDGVNYTRHAVGSPAFDAADRYAE